MTFAITGATGYIGTRLIALLKKKGIATLALSRKKITAADAWLAYDLQQTEIALPDHVTCVVHLAMNYDLHSEEDQHNEIKATQRLLDAAEKINATFIYLSSQTAAANATTAYGKTKWAIEKIVTQRDGIIIRPGMVYGGIRAGLFGQMTRLVKTLPAIPFFFPAPQVQPIHVDDLCECIIASSTQRTGKNIYCVASAKPVDFHIFLQHIAKDHLRVTRFNIPIPRVLIRLAQALAPQNASLIRLQSLFTLPEMESSQDLQRLNCKLRSLDAGMQPKGTHRRRLLLIEGFTFFSYCLRAKSQLMPLRRYVHVIEQLRNKKPLGMCNLLKKARWLVAVTEKNSQHFDDNKSIEFHWRLNAATSIAETSPQGAKHYLRLNQHNSFFMSAAICTKAVLQEIALRLFSVVAGKWIIRLAFTRSKPQ